MEFFKQLIANMAANLYGGILIFLQIFHFLYIGFGWAFAGLIAVKYPSVGLGMIMYWGLALLVAISWPKKKVN